MVVAQEASMDVDSPVKQEPLQASAESGSVATATASTEVDEKPTTFKWTIPNFLDVKDRKLYSKNYEFGDDKWRILIFPRGNNVPDHTSVYLDFANAGDMPEGWNKLAQFSLGIVPDPKAGSTTELMRREAQHRFNVEESDWGFSQFVKRSHIEDKSYGYLQNGTDLVIEATVMNVKDTYYEFWNYDSKKETGFVGLKNQGATCYMNSLLQTLYHTHLFRKDVYLMPTAEDKATKGIALALQRVFYLLQSGDKSVATKELTSSFGWDVVDAFTQHDVQELNRVLCDNLEEKMKGTCVEGEIGRMFEGKLTNYIKCINVDYASTRTESFYDLSLNVKGCSDILASFDQYTEEEQLDGDNKYQAEGFGLQDAKKGCKFQHLPPVLHLQLKRFEYDPMRDAMVKVNDRHEFHTKMDLTKYMGDDADPSISQVYVLHSVLVHSGDLHGGHYYAFIRPNVGTPEGDSQWYKFDDDRVVLSNEKESLDDNFGGEDRDQVPGRKVPGGGAKRFSNAYMLVYIREDELNTVMSPITDADLPDALRTRFEQDKQADVQKKKDKQEAHLYFNMRVVRPEDISAHTGAELVAFEQAECLRVKKSEKLMHVKELIQEKFGVPVARQRLWNWVARQNKTVRPDTAYSEDDNNLPLEKLFSVKGIERDLRILLDVVEPGASIAPPPESEYLLFFKFYDPVTQSLECVGKLLVSQNRSVHELLPHLCRLKSLDTKTPLIVYEEVRSTMVEEVDVKKTFDECELGNGDILIFQMLPIPEETPALRFTAAPTYLHYINNRVEVEIRKLETPKVAEFSIELSKKMNFDEVVEEMGNRLRLDPRKLRLTASSSHAKDQPRTTPIRRAEYNNVTNIDQMLSLYDGATSHILFYELLEHSLNEVESNRVLKIGWHNNKSVEVKSHQLLMAKDSKVCDIIHNLQSLVDFEGTKQIRIMEVWSHKITKVLADSDALRVVGQDNLHAEEVLEEEMHLTKNETLVPVCHISKDNSFSSCPHAHGVPFLLRVSAADTLADIKPRIQARLGIADEEFAKWKFCYLHLNRAEAIEEDEKLTEKHEFSYGTSFLGLEHPDTTPRKNYHYEKPVKIYN